MQGKRKLHEETEAIWHQCFLRLLPPLLKFLYCHPDKRHTHIAELKAEIRPCSEIYNTNGATI